MNVVMDPMYVIAMQYVRITVEVISASASLVLLVMVPTVKVCHINV